MSTVPTDSSMIVDRLRASGSVFAEDEAAMLVAEAHTPQELESMVERRVAGLPLEVIVGWAEFCGLRIVVEPGVFVPRRRTELLVREAAAAAEPGAVILDLCCGTGAVGAALHDVLGGEPYASDIEPAAVRCARRNVEPCGGHVYEGDLYERLPGMLRGRVDLLVVNAPYVPTDAIATMPPEARVHEPRVALDGGMDGVDVQRRVAAQAGEWLAADGHLLIETSERQAPTTVEAFVSGGLDARVVHSDDLDSTVVVGVRGG